jgi:hypothetical protein
MLAGWKHLANPSGFSEFGWRYTITKDCGSTRDKCARYLFYQDYSSFGGNKSCVVLVHRVHAAVVFMAHCVAQLTTVLCLVTVIFYNGLNRRVLFFLPSVDL